MTVSDLDDDGHAVPPARAELLETLHHQLRAFNAEAAMYSHVVAAHLGIGPTDLQCLNMLGAAGALPAGRLAEHTGLATATVTGVIDRLERAGYVRRERDSDDRRRVLVVPQPEVWRRVSPLFTAIHRATDQLCARYDERELAAILDFVRSSRPLIQDETAALRNTSPQRRRKP